jgi:hypothetical protein
MKGDDTINIVSTPHFPESPLEPEAPVKSSKSKLCMRLFEDSSVSYLSDWTTDSVAEESELEDEPENEFRWSATP